MDRSASRGHARGGSGTMDRRGGRHSRISSGWVEHLSSNDGRPQAAASLNDRKKEFRIIAFILAPAIVTTFVMLSLYWDDDEHGAGMYSLKWWCLVEGLRLCVSISLSYILQLDVDRSAADVDRLDRISRYVSLFSFFWFITGHVLLLLCRASGECTATHLFTLALVLIVLQYTLMLLPLIVFLVLAPFICLCMPCFILLFYNKSTVKGASKREINRLPTEKFSAQKFVQTGYDNECAICIADFQEEETVRILHCRHVFHKDCVDSWLILNGTCPICRNNISNQPGGVRPATFTAFSGPPHDEPAPGMPIDNGDDDDGGGSGDSNFNFRDSGVTPTSAPPAERPPSPSLTNSNAPPPSSAEQHIAEDNTRDLEQANRLDCDASPGTSSDEPTTRERVRASSFLFSRVFSFRSIVARSNRHNRRHSLQQSASANQLDPNADQGAVASPPREDGEASSRPARPAAVELELV